MNTENNTGANDDPCRTPTPSRKKGENKGPQRTQVKQVVNQFSSSLSKQLGMLCSFNLTNSLR